jgi:homopolymeric O-antigen transport system permease protein
VTGAMVVQSISASAELPPPSRMAAAWGDLLEGSSRSWMWSAMAMQDIKLRYRGSVLGPFWLTISTVIMVAAIGLIYARLFNMEIGRYLPFLTIGLVIWQYMSSLITDGCQTFLSAQNVIHQVPMPFSIHAWRSVYRNLIVLAHNIVIVPVVLVIFTCRSAGMFS